MRRPLCLSAACLCVAASMFLGCDGEKKEPATCLEARAAARAHAEAGDTQRATEQLEIAKSSCGQASAYDLDRIERQLQREVRRQTQLAETKTETKGPLTEFMQWVTSRRERNERRTGTTVCEPRESPSFGFCTSSVSDWNPRSEGEVAPLEVHFQESQPHDVFRFHWQSGAPLRCPDVGPHRVVTSWKVEDVEHDLCELTAHGVRGLEVFIRRAPGTSQIDVFSQKYLLAHPDFARSLRRR